MSNNQPQKLNGAQKLEALEKALGELTAKTEKQMQIIAEELNKIEQQMQAVSKRLVAMVKAGDTEEGMNSDTVKKAVMEESVRELKAKVDMFVQQGILIRNDEKTIDDQTFVVGHEEDLEGKMVNPRTQFLVAALHPEEKAKVNGLKVGATIKNEALGQIMFIDEAYDLKQPQQVQEAAEQAEATESAPEQEQAAGAEVMRTKAKRPRK